MDCEGDMPHKDPEARARANRQAARRHRARKRAEVDGALKEAQALPAGETVDDVDVEVVHAKGIEIPQSLLGDHPQQADISRVATSLLQRLLSAPSAQIREIDKISKGTALLRLMGELAKDIQVATDDKELMDRLARLEAAIESG